MQAREVAMDIDEGKGWHTFIVKCTNQVNNCKSRRQAKMRDRGRGTDIPVWLGARLARATTWCPAATH